MKVGWLADAGNADGTLGGAELTQLAFRGNAPDGVEVVEVRPGASGPDLDRFVVHNCVTYSLDDLWQTLDKPVVKFWHDTGPHLNDQVRDELFRSTTSIFCSPIQAERMGFPDGLCIPPAIDLEPFRIAAENAGERKGSVTVGAWMNYGKSPLRAREVAPDVDFYGSGPCSPPNCTPVDYEAMPELLARYRTFIHLPTVLEPFGRAVVEAWAAGCKIVTNRLVGARHWIEREPEKLDTASRDFWEVVLSA